MHTVLTSAGFTVGKNVGKVGKENRYDTECTDNTWQFLSMMLDDADDAKFSIDSRRGFCSRRLSLSQRLKSQQHHDLYLTMTKQSQWTACLPAIQSCPTTF